MSATKMRKEIVIAAVKAEIIAMFYVARIHGSVQFLVVGSVGSVVLLVVWLGAVVGFNVVDIKVLRADFLKRERK